jgi:carbon storage regulator CsrA
MLVLSRKSKQEIVIGDNVVITVLKIKGNTVRLGIEAPRDIHVVRGELPRSSEFGPIVEPLEPEVAEFTVVFSNSNDEQTPEAGVIPFQNQTSDRANGKKAESPKHDSDSIQFRGKLPTPLQHNRLQEIVSRLTSNSETTNS